MHGYKIKSGVKKKEKGLNCTFCILHPLSFIVGLLLFLLSTSSVFSSEKVEIVAIKSRDTTPYNTTLRGFKDYLNRKGIEANIIELSLEQVRKNELIIIHEEIMSTRPDLILTIGTPATKLAQQTIKDIPVIFTMVLDPKGSKILSPGVSMDIPPEIKLKNIKRVLPRAKRIGVIYSPDSISTYKEVLQVSSRLDFQLIGEKINSRKEFPDAFKHLWWQIDCFLMIPDTKIYFPSSVEYLLVEGLRKKIPIIGLSSNYTKAGALISFDCDYRDLGEQAAEIALEILTGNNQIKTKFTQPRKIDFSLNLLVAEKLKIKIPSKIINAARKVFGK